MSKLSSLTLALTAYNEEEAVPQTAARAIRFLSDTAERWELLIVDDGSTDGTVDILRTLTESHANVRILTHETNRGMGAAIRTAIEAAQSKWFCTIAADGQVDPLDLTAFIEPALYYPAVFSTYLNRRDGWDRTFLSNGLRLLMAITTGTWKIPTGNYFIQTNILKSFHLRSTSFFVNFEVFLETRRSRHPYVWVQIPCAARPSGQSKIRNVRTILRVTRELFRYRLGLP
ncbi:MAG TPA: glycosyltransferase family 2 protein [Bdellovibrionota bacterium]|nr:glycosyltransferase family 2 protein [Bdellovibrionota bacterium]